MSRAIDVSNWKRFYHDKRHHFWWGIVILIVIEVTVVLGFITSFFYLWIKGSEPGANWIPYPSSEIPILYPTINTIILFLCAYSMYYGGVVMDRGNQRGFFWTTVFCCVAGSIALYLRWIHLAELNFSWADNAYASFLWTLTGFHFLHVTSAIWGTAVIGYYAMKGYYSVDRQIAVKVDTLYWYFVFAGWLPMYFTLYWVPRMV